MYQTPSLLTSPKGNSLPRTTLPSTLFFAVLFSKDLWWLLDFFFVLFLCALFSTHLSSALPSFLTYLLERSSDGTNGVKGCSVMLCIAG